MMTWVAFDRAIKGAEYFHREGTVERWRALRGRIHEEICRNAFDPKIGAFVQSYGSKNLDASLLLMPAVGFLPPMIQGLEARLPLSSDIYWRTALSGAMTPRKLATVSPQARAYSSLAAFGSRIVCW